MTADNVPTWTLWLSCDDCGDIEVRAADSSLRYAKTSGDFTVTYECPTCGRRDVVAVRNSFALGALFDAGMQAVTWSLEPDRVPAGLEPLTHQEIARVAELLDEPEWLADNCPRS